MAGSSWRNFELGRRRARVTPRSYRVLAMVAFAILGSGTACNPGPQQDQPTGGDPGVTKPGDGGAADPVSCTKATDCSYATLDPIKSSNDCACPRCPSQSRAINRSTLTERESAFRRYCSTWAQTHPCPPTLCQPPAPVTCSKGGSCELDAR
jgi:hypothetical protein